MNFLLMSWSMHVCDCYQHECEEPGCDQKIPMHIANWEFERSMFKCWCPTHYKKAPRGAHLFAVVSAGYEKLAKAGKTAKFKVYAIVGPRVTPDRNDNKPNCQCNYIGTKT